MRLAGQKPTDASLRGYCNPMQVQSGDPELEHLSGARCCRVSW